MDSGSAVARDSAVPPEQPVLLAEVDGHVLAALVLSDGTVVADSFHPTPDLIDLLRATPAAPRRGSDKVFRPLVRTFSTPNPGLGARQA